MSQILRRRIIKIYPSGGLSSVRIANGKVIVQEVSVKALSRVLRSDAGDAVREAILEAVEQNLLGERRGGREAYALPALEARYIKGNVLGESP